MKHEKILKMTGREYIHYLYEQTKDGRLAIEYDEGDVVTYPMAWDSRAAETLAERFEVLRRQLEGIAAVHDSLGDREQNMQILTTEQLEVWQTYIARFPDHGMDEETLVEIWQKEELGEALSESEKRMSRLFNKWFDARYLERLPYKACAPNALISKARGYERLISLHAPEVVIQNGCRSLAREMVLYHCAKPFHYCRCCGAAYELDMAGVTHSVCPVCMWEEDHTPEDEYSHTNGASLRQYRKRYFTREETKGV